MRDEVYYFKKYYKGLTSVSYYMYVPYLNSVIYKHCS